MKKGILLILAVFLVSAAAFAGAKKDTSGQTVVKIGLTGEEFRPAWSKVAEIVAKDGIKVELVDFSDYSQPNRALNDGDIDLNSFQHYAFLEGEINDHNYAITALGNTGIFFLGVYSRKITSLDQLKNGDTVVIMNDATNGGRALKVLESAGVFTVDPSKGNLPTVQDITSNPKNIKIVEVDAAQTWRNLDDPVVAAAVVNSTFVIDGGGNPAKDAIFIKPLDSAGEKQYINLVAVRTAEKDNPVYRKLLATFQSPEIAAVIEESLKGSALPAW
ncbi:lipoprotein [Spirochaetia bacterium]|nr:lipoprotein [Spirochaetia bacterium]